MRLEAEGRDVLVDVLGVEYERRTKNNDAVRAHRVIDAAGGELHCELLASGALDGPVDEIHGNRVGEVAEVSHVPESEYGGLSALDEVNHALGGSEAGDEDLAGHVLGLDDLRRGNDANGGRGDDDLEVRVSREQSLSLRGADRRVVIAVNGGD